MPSNPPENNGDRAVNHHETPSPVTSSDQSLESVLSRLNISSDEGFRSQSTSSRNHQAVFDNGIASSSYSILQSPGGSDLGVVFHQYIIDNPYIINGAFDRPHLNFDVDSTSSARDPYLQEDDPNQLMQVSYDASHEKFGRNFMHGQESMFANSSFNGPVVPFSWEHNYCSSSYTDQHLYEPPQKLAFEDMRRGIVSLAKDQVSSRILKYKLKGLHEREIDMILLQLMGSWIDLLMNQFGSKFVLNFFAVCNENQRTRIITAIVKVPSDLVTICLNHYGTTAIQKLLGKLCKPQHILFVIASLSRGVLALATDPNGQHVIKYCVRHFPWEYTEDLIYEMNKNFYRIATDKSGCCVLKTCVENSLGKARAELISKIVANAIPLAEDPYGNYVVQHLLGLESPIITNYLLKRFQGRFVFLSCNKYASNVVEKMLESGEDVSTPIVKELLTSPNASLLPLDPFGNFVIQSALSVAKEEVLDLLLNFIRVNALSMQSNLYGSKILARRRKCRRFHTA